MGVAGEVAREIGAFHCAHFRGCEAGEAEADGEAAGGFYKISSG